MPKQKRDGIAELEEWQEHRYSPGYWVNRYSVHFPLKRTRGNQILQWLRFGIFLPFFLFVLIVFLADRNPAYIILLVLFGGSLLITGLTAINLRPLGLTQKDRDRLRTKNNGKGKKGLPKRRKDYR